MKFTKLSWELLIFNLFMASLLLIGLFYNLTQKLYASDYTYATFINTGILAYSVLLCLYHSYTGNRIDKLLMFLSFISVKIYLYLGLMGTILGLYIFLKAGDSSLQELAPVFFSTYVGLGARVWTECNIYIFRKNALEESI